MKKKLKQNIIFLLISFILIALLFIPLNYYIVAEGNVYSAKDFINIQEKRENRVLLPSVVLYENAYFSKFKSAYYNKIKINVYELIYASLSKKAEIRNLKDLLPKDTTSEDFENGLAQITLISSSNIKLVVASALNKSWEDLADIKINMTNEGSSVSLGLALDLYNQLSEEDLLKDKKVGAFGTLADTGDILEVNEEKLKLDALEKENVKLVFLSLKDYTEEIKSKKYPFTIIPISNFNEALNYLNN